MNTAPIIKTVVNWWKILNVKSKDWFNNKLQAVLQDPFVKRLNTIPKFGEMALKIKGGLGKHYKQFTPVTILAIHRICNGIASLYRSLLRVSHVLLGTFSTDPFLKEFGKLHQESGGTYFTTVQQIIKKVRLSKASLLLSTNVNVDIFKIDSGHSYFSCSFLLDEYTAEMFDVCRNQSLHFWKAPR